MKRSPTENRVPAWPLASFPDGLVEACCLACVAAVPILYDPHGVLGFQPFKASFFRALALLCVLGSILKRLFPLGPGRPSKVPLQESLGNGLAAGGLFVLAAAISSWFSILPWGSWWGLAQFNEGFVTKAAWIILFAGAVVVFNDRRQIERLVTIALAASLPVALFAIFQRLGLDPGRFAQNTSDVLYYPVNCVPRSFGGNPIYMAGYLGMLVPLCAMRIHQSFAVCRGNWIERSAYTLLLALQISALLTSHKRGPLLALILTGVFAVFLWGVIQRKFRLLAVSLVLVTIFASALYGLAWFARSNPAVSELPVLAPLSQIMPVSRNEGGDLYRRELWELAPRLFTGQVDFKFPDGRPDNCRAFRFLLGYGPETVGAVSPQARLLDRMGPQMNPESRYHNLLWDTWHATGIAGLVALVWLVMCALLSGAGALRIWRSQRECLAIAGAMLAGGLLGGTLLAACYHRGFEALGFELGLVAGFAGGVAFIGVFRRQENMTEKQAPLWLTPFALVCAVVMHWLDSSFVFQTGNTSALFWIFAGVLCSPGVRDFWKRREPSDLAGGQVAPHFQKKASSPVFNAAFAAALLSCLVLLPMIYGFVDLKALKEFDVSTVLRASFLLVKSYDHPSFLVLLVVVPSLLGVVYFSVLSVWQNSPSNRLGPLYWIALGWSLVILFATAWGKAWWLTFVGPFANGPDVMLQATRFEIMACLFLALFLLLVLLVAGSISRPGWWSSKTRSAVSLGMGATVATAICVLAGVPIRAELLEGWANALSGIGRMHLSGPVFDRAISLVPGRISNRIEASNAALSCALAARNPDDFTKSMDKAALLLAEGRRFSELDDGNLSLGRLLLIRILLNQEPSRRHGFVEKADEALLRATAFSPLSEQAWFLRSLLQRDVLNNQPEAANCLQRANRFVQSSGEWADYYAHLAATAPVPAMREGFARRAVSYFASAVFEASPAMWKNGDVYRYHMVSGTLLRNLGENEAARNEFASATYSACSRPPWEANAMLATIACDSRDYGTALNFAQTALEQCPRESRNDLLALKEKILLERSLH